MYSKTARRASARVRQAPSVLVRQHPITVDLLLVDPAGTVEGRPDERGDHGRVLWNHGKLTLPGGKGDVARLSSTVIAQSCPSERPEVVLLTVERFATRLARRLPPPLDSRSTVYEFMSGPSP